MCYPITHAWYVDCPITQSNYKPDAYTFPLELKSGWWLPIMFENFVMVLISQCRFKLETNYQILSRHFCQQISLLVRFFKLINVSIKDFWVLFIVFWSFISWFYITLKGKTRALIVDLCRSPGKEAMIKMSIRIFFMRRSKKSWTAPTWEGIKAFSFLTSVYITHYRWTLQLTKCWSIALSTY